MDWRFKKMQKTRISSLLVVEVAKEGRTMLVLKIESIISKLDIVVWRH